MSKLQDVLFEALLAQHKEAVGRGSMIRAQEALRDLIVFLYTRTCDPAQCACKTGVMQGDLKVTGNVVAYAQADAPEPTKSTDELNPEITAELKQLYEKLEAAKASSDATATESLEKQIALLEDTVILYRLSRSPERKVFHIDTGRLPPEEAKAKLETLVEEFKAETPAEVQNDEFNGADPAKFDHDGDGKPGGSKPGRRTPKKKG